MSTTDDANLCYLKLYTMPRYEDLKYILATYKLLMGTFKHLYLTPLAAR